MDKKEKNKNSCIDYRTLAVKPSYKEAQRTYTKMFMVRNKMKNPKQQ